MGLLRIGEKIIPLVEQEITVDGSRDKRLWCNSISLSAGLGGNLAEFTIPEMLSDDDRERYRDKKVVVKAGLGNASKTVFIGYLVVDNSSLSPDADQFTMHANSVGFFLNKIGVGEDLNRWNYEYKLYNEDRTPTGYTPVNILIDLFSRLPGYWSDEVKLGDLRPLLSNDIATTSFNFNLQSYAQAVDYIASAFGDVAIKERFRGDKTYIDFYKVSDVSSPVNTLTCSRWNHNTSANVYSLSMNENGGELINRCQAFGRDKCFVVTLQSNVTGIDWSEQDPLLAMRKDWDTTLETFAKSDPKLCQSDITQAKVKIIGEKPGEGATTFKVDAGSLPLASIVNKANLIHTGTKEVMRLTGFTAKVDIDLEDPESEAVPATVTVIRRYNQNPDVIAMSDLKIKDTLAIEVPGISRVYREYIFPEIFNAFPEKEILNNIPVLDAQTKEQIDNQVFRYKSTISPNAIPETPDPEDETPENKLTGLISRKMELLKGCRIDLKKKRVQLNRAALEVVAVEKGTTGIIKKTYAETPIGVTFAYVDHYYPFGWDTGVVGSDSELPWSIMTERIKLDEFQYNQVTNTDWPLMAISDGVLTPHVMKGWILDPRTNELAYNGLSVLRNEVSNLRAAAEAKVMEKNRRHISFSVDVPWLDTSFVLGNRIEVKGYEGYKKDIYTINQITLDMPIGGSHRVSITCDNVKPPIRTLYNIRKTVK